MDRAWIDQMGLPRWMETFVQEQGRARHMGAGGGRGPQQPGPVSTFASHEGTSCQACRVAGMEMLAIGAGTSPDLRGDFLVEGQSTRKRSLQASCSSQSSPVHSLCSPTAPPILSVTGELGYETASFLAGSDFQGVPTKRGTPCCKWVWPNAVYVGHAPKTAPFWPASLPSSGGHMCTSPARSAWGMSAVGRRGVASFRGRI